MFILWICSTQTFIRTQFAEQTAQSAHFQLFKLNCSKELNFFVIKGLELLPSQRDPNSEILYVPELVIKKELNGTVRNTNKQQKGKIFNALPFVSLFVLIQCSFYDAVPWNLTEGITEGGAFVFGQYKHSYNLKTYKQRGKLVSYY